MIAFQKAGVGVLYGLTMLLLSLSSSSVGSATSAPPVPAPPAVPAKSYLLMDFNSGRVIAESNADMRLEPASLTKIMTVYVAGKELANSAIQLKDTMTVSEEAWKMKGSRMFIEAGNQVSIEDLLKGVIVQSGNDASVALAEAFSGTEQVFVSVMNNHAELLGLANTNFVNSSGWPETDHYTTARDLAVLTRALVLELPDLYGWFALREFTYNGITQPNRNKLLYRDASVDGVKTGHTEAAGYCLVASAKQDDMRLISVVMGLDSDAARVEATQSLLGYGFRFFETHLLYDSQRPVTEVPVWKAEVEVVRLGLEERLFVTIPRRRYDDLQAYMEIDENLIAPLEAGQQRGTVRVLLDEEELAVRPLMVLETVPEAGLLSRLVDGIRLLFE
jgi:D-alanyl-D-alanine carboxypeptidase (penicillin-binding protein 5/6)